MDSVDTYWADYAMLEWQVELGADEAIGDAPVDRYALEDRVATPALAPQPVQASGKPVAPPPVPERVEIDAAALALQAAGAAGDLPALIAAASDFPHCPLRQGARKAVFADGLPEARLLIVGEAPNRAEDRAGAPFVGDEGLLLDKMLAAIGLARDADDIANAAYLLAPLPWRTPTDGPPAPAHIAMMRPFLERHIALANPEVIVMMGSTALEMLTGQGGLTRVRGQWTTVLDRPAIPMAHPAQLLRNPLAKRDAWADLLAIKAKLKELT